MSPAEGELDVAAVGQHLVAAITVDLQHAPEARKMGDGPLGLAVRRIDIGDAGRVRSAPWPVVTRVGPKLPGLGAPPPGIEHRSRGLVGEELGRGFQHREQPFVHGPQQESRPPDPIGQGGAIERKALSGEDLRLPVQRQVVGVFGDEHLRHGRIRRQPALDQPCRRGRLHDDVLAGTAGVFGSADDQHPELGRDDVEALGDVFANPVQQARTAWTCPALDVDHGLDARQVSRQGATVGPAPSDP